MGGLCSGGIGMGCMAISWTLLGSLRLASVARDIRSTCSKMEAEDSCSFAAPFIGGGPKEGKKKAEKHEPSIINTEQSMHVYRPMLILTWEHLLNKDIYCAAVTHKTVSCCMDMATSDI